MAHQPNGWKSIREPSRKEAWGSHSELIAAAHYNGWPGRSDMERGRKPARGDELSLRMGFGAALRSQRTRANLTQEGLAQRAGLHRNHIGFLERAEQTPTLVAMARLASALGMSTAELVQLAEDAAR